MDFWRIKLENIFAITMILILTIMSIKYLIINGFDSFAFMFDILFVTLSSFIVWYCVKKTREFYLNNKERD